MKTKYTKNVEWLKDYVEAAEHLVPINQIKKVCGYKVKLGLVESQDAAIHVANSTASKFIITIKLYDQFKHNNKLQHVAMPLSCILDSLAHELAHLGTFDHEPEHFRLQNRIMSTFYKVLKKHKIDDTSKQFIKYYNHAKK